MSQKKEKLTAIISLVILIISFLLSLILGAEKISFSSLTGNLSSFEKIILFKLRLPRSCLVLLTGILLGGSGAVFQVFFRNPLAEPGIMGISSGATLGAVIASLLLFPVNFFAFAGALGAGILVTLLAFKCRNTSSSIMLLLCGTALGTLYSSLSSILLLIGNKELHSVFNWILGSFNGRTWKEFYFILPFSIISICMMFAIAPSLDLLSGGETSASALGVEVNRLRILVLASGALAVSSAVCAGGTIGFVGLIAPHIVRKIIGPNARKLIPLSMIFGAILLLLSDLLARIIIAPSELPAGIITSILGVPFFLALCINKSE